MGFCCSCESLWLAPGWRGQTSHWRVSDARFFLSDSFATLTVSRKTFYSLLFHCKPLFVLLLGKFNFRVPQGVRGPQTVKRHFWTFDGTGLWARNQNWCSLKFWTNSVSCRKKGPDPFHFFCLVRIYVNRRKNFPCLSVLAQTVQVQWTISFPALTSQTRSLNITNCNGTGRYMQNLLL